jgi:hypothetical protein
MIGDKSGLQSLSRTADALTISLSAERDEKNDENGSVTLEKKADEKK